MIKMDENSFVIIRYADGRIEVIDNIYNPNQELINRLFNDKR